MNDDLFARDFILEGQPNDTALVDLVDHLLDTGCVIHGDLVLGVADIDLIYLELSVLLCSVDRLLSMGRQV